ncbi:hypothetical protein DFJ73DRAFT_118050 [Zopfochytrium polystomum]|nr:hypothetical protein DFJ73DRAFT_118050 [Zopfochytrium polystomum]
MDSDRHGVVRDGREVHDGRGWASPQRRGNAIARLRPAIAVDCRRANGAAPADQQPGISREALASSDDVRSSESNVRPLFFHDSAGYGDHRGPGFPDASIVERPLDSSWRRHAPEVVYSSSIIENATITSYSSPPCTIRECTQSVPISLNAPLRYSGSDRVIRRPGELELVSNGGSSMDRELKPNAPIYSNDGVAISRPPPPPCRQSCDREAVWESGLVPPQEKRCDSALPICGPTEQIRSADRTVSMPNINRGERDRNRHLASTQSQSPASGHRKLPTRSTSPNKEAPSRPSAPWHFTGGRRHPRPNRDGRIAAPSGGGSRARRGIARGRSLGMCCCWRFGRDGRARAADPRRGNGRDWGSQGGAGWLAEAGDSELRSKRASARAIPQGQEAAAAGDC